MNHVGRGHVPAVPRKRQTVRTNKFVCIWQLLHEIATPNVRTGFAMTWEGGLYAVGSSYTGLGHVPKLQYGYRSAVNSETPVCRTVSSKSKRGECSGSPPVPRRKNTPGACF